MVEEIFEIDREGLYRYFRTKFLIFTLFIPGWILLLIGFEKTLRRYVDSLTYGLRNGNLHIAGSLRLWRLPQISEEISIPLTKITELRLTQGPLLSGMNQWALNVRVANSSSLRPGGISLLGLARPQDVRDRILQAVGEAPGAETR